MLGLEKLNQTTFGDLSAQSRRRKGALLHELLHIDDDTRVLDVGGQLDPAGRQVIESHPQPSNVTVLNLDQSHLEAIGEAYPEVTTVQGDATSLPFDDCSFDLVYSNAVIEHIPTREGQKAMAQEIQRVGRTWFVTTPNRWYPFELHTRLPFVSWLPTPLMMRVARLVSYSHVRKRYRFRIHRDTIRLLTQQQMQELFPESRVIQMQVTFWPETIVVAGPEENLQTSRIPS